MKTLFIFHHVRRTLKTGLEEEELSVVAALADRV